MNLSQRKTEIKSVWAEVKGLRYAHRLLHDCYKLDLNTVSVFILLFCSAAFGLGPLVNHKLPVWKLAAIQFSKCEGEKKQMGGYRKLYNDEIV